VRSADDSGSFVFVLDELGGAETAEVEVALLVDKEVVGFEVADDDLHFGQVLEEEDDRGDVELRVSRREDTDFADDLIQRLP
jgi:hypothetical protein